MMLTGSQFIAGEERKGGRGTFHALAAATGGLIAPEFTEAGAADVDDACSAAGAAQEVFGSLAPAERAAFLHLCADKIDALGSDLTERAMMETGLPAARLEGERGRTVTQLRMFADEVVSGRWLRARVDFADPTRTPPKPELRLRMIPVGPVAVFGASNFPLAFSVAGGDTAAAFAAGCCVVAKGHPAHPGTAELVARAIDQSVREHGLPRGVFSLLQGTSNQLGEALVRNPEIAAVGFTGSRAGGLALVAHAANRSVPIPVYAEMSSVNPVVLLPHRLEEAAEQLGQSYAASLTLGAGQFCTNPGIVFAVGGAACERFVAAAVNAVAEMPQQTMLTPAIRTSYVAGLARIAGYEGVQLAGAGEGGQACVFTVDGADFLANPGIAQENFGPSSVVIQCSDIGEMKMLLHRMEGQLTATLHINEADYPVARDLLPLLERLAGRVIVNGWPTGVEVAHAMVHGGPFPATSDGRSTSVGTMAIDRFLRPVAYQDFPADLLPEALLDV